MKLVIPLAGRGLRYAGRGFDVPKPLVPVAGKPIVQRAFESLSELPRSDVIFIALREHDESFGVGALLRQIAGRSAKVILLDSVTEGQLCTVLAARELIATDEDLLIASSDTIVDATLGPEIAAMPSTCRGIISVADLPGDQWSFARTDESGRVVEVAEKRRISSHASTGLYYFSEGREFVDAGEDLVRRGLSTRGEYYVIPVYQTLIETGREVRISTASRVWDLGTPEGKSVFEASHRGGEARL